VLEGDDFGELFAAGAVEVGVDLGAGDAEVFAGEGDRFVVLDLEVVVVDAVDGEGEGGGRRRCGLVGDELAGGGGLGGVLLGDDGLEAFAGGLEGTFVNVGPDPAATEFLGYGAGGAGAEKAVKHHVAGVGRSADYAFKERFWFLRRIVESFFGRVSYTIDIVPNAPKALSVFIVEIDL